MVTPLDEARARLARAERTYAAHTHPKMLRRTRFDADAAMAAKRELDEARAALDALAAKGEG